MCGIFDSELRDFLADDFFLDAFWLVLLDDVGIYLFRQNIFVCFFARAADTRSQRRLRPAETAKIRASPE